MQPNLSLSFGFLKDVADPAARSLILAGLAAAAIGAFRVRSISWKAATWRGVLVAALAMPLMGSLLPPFRVPVPALGTRHVVIQPSSAAVAPTEYRVLVAQADEATRSDVVDSSGLQETPAVAHAIRQPIPWILIFAGIYLAVALLLLVRIFVGTAFGKRLVRKAIPIGDAAALRRVALLARRSGLREQPLLAESDSLVVPVTLRVRRPAIVLPASWSEWDEPKLSAVLAHEISHVARRDALFQQLALVHRALFWFSPLAWWLPRYLDDLAEQASDEAALACGMERARYAETLLGFMGALENSHSRVWWQGLAMAKNARTEKRLDRILDWRNAMPNKLQKSFLVAMAVLAAPLVALTASVNPFLFDLPQSTAPATPQAPPAPAAAPLPRASAHPVVNPGPAPEAPTPMPAAVASPAVPPLPAAPAIAGLQPAPQAPAAAPVSPSTAVAPASPAAANVVTPAPPSAVIAGQTGDVSSGVQGGVSGGTGGGVYTGVYDEGPHFVIVTKGSSSVIMSGSSEDAAHAKALRSKISGDFIWFERDEKPYIIRDQATVQRAEQLWQPVQELGRQQEALGKQQELLGQTQENVGRQMESVRVKIPDLSTEMEELEAKMKQLSANGGTVEQIGELQSEIGELQSRVGEIQSQAGRQQSEIGSQQGELGRKQGELGRQQGELGRRQGELSRRASQQMKQLLDDAVAHGLAQPE